MKIFPVNFKFTLAIWIKNEFFSQRIQRRDAFRTLETLVSVFKKKLVKISIQNDGAIEEENFKRLFAKILNNYKLEQNYMDFFNISK